MILKQIDLVNIQTIKKFSASFEGNVYLVTGENELGKSTLLKAIAILLTGSRDEVLTIGAEKGFAKAIFGENGKEYEVELRVTKANPRGTLTIKDKVSGLQSDKISTLNEIFGYQNFDAQEFIQWSESAEGRRRQVEAVKSLLPADIQKRILEIDQETERLKATRKEDNSEVKMYANVQKEKELGIKLEDETKYAQPVKIETLMEQQSLAIQKNEQIKGAKERQDTRTKELEAIPALIDELQDKSASQVLELMKEEEQLKEELARKLEALAKKRQDLIGQTNKKEEELKTQQKELKEKNEKAAKWLEVNKPIPTDELKAKIEGAARHNEMHQKIKELKQARENAQKAQTKADEKNTKIEALQTEREQIIKDSRLPVDGLSFTDEGLILNSVSFSSGNVSDSQIMEVCARLIMAKNPRVKLFRIGRGESLGAKRLKAIIDFAKANGYQGFIEQVVRGQNELIVEEYNEK